MACGATYALVPFIDRNALGGVAGIIGAGGNVGAVAAGFLLKGLLDVQTCLFILGGLVMVAGCSVILIRFTTEHKEKEQVLLNKHYLNVIPQLNFTRSRDQNDVCFFNFLVIKYDP